MLQFPAETNNEKLQFSGKESFLSEFKTILDKLTEKFKQANPPLIFSDTQKHFIIFLDFDGVCWTHDDNRPDPRYMNFIKDPELLFLLRQHSSFFEKHFGYPGDFFLRLACWDPEHMSRIRNLCMTHNARIVVSSSWRRGATLSHLQNWLDLWGLGKYVIGRTKDGNYAYGPRDEEIEEWLQNFQHLVKGFIVLDDGFAAKLQRKFKNKFIYCDSAKGFDAQAYDRANEALLAQKMALENEQGSEIIDKLTLKPLN